jgi:glycosyltransferase involved in cell wall biosynthesis
MPDISPRVSVLMPVYNGALYLRQAVDSILTQTFTDFELIVLYDVSSDGSLDVLKSYRDNRLVIFENNEKCGLPAILNKGLEMARGAYIARMDSDDVSLPRRFERQVAFLDTHPDVGICGTWFRDISTDGFTINTVSRNVSDVLEYPAYLFFNPYLGHPTVMMRGTLFRDHNLRYDPAVYAEDYDLWSRALRYGQICNIPEVMLHYRRHPNQLSGVQGKHWESTREIRRVLLEGLEIFPDAGELEFHQMICTSCFEPEDELMRQVDSWLCRLMAANDRKGCYDREMFAHAVVERWFVLCFHAVKRGKFSLAICLGAEVLKSSRLGWGYMIRYLLRNVCGVAGDHLRNKVGRILGRSSG